MHAWGPRAERAETAVARGDDVFASDNPRVLQNSLRDKVRVFHESRYGVNHAGMRILPSGNLTSCQTSDSGSIVTT
jgi:hypothetical protein